VAFAKLRDLPGLGFTEKLGQLAEAGFPGADCYFPLGAERCDTGRQW